MKDLESKIRQIDELNNLLEIKEQAKNKFKDELKSIEYSRGNESQSIKQLRDENMRLVSTNKSLHQALFDQEEMIKDKDLAIKTLEKRLK